MVRIDYQSENPWRTDPTFRAKTKIALPRSGSGGELERRFDTTERMSAVLRITWQPRAILVTPWAQSYEAAPNTLVRSRMPDAVSKGHLMCKPTSTSRFNS